MRGLRWDEVSRSRAMASSGFACLSTTMGSLRSAYWISAPSSSFLRPPKRTAWTLRFSVNEPTGYAPIVEPSVGLVASRSPQHPDARTSRLSEAASVDRWASPHSHPPSSSHRRTFARFPFRGFAALSARLLVSPLLTPRLPEPRGLTFHVRSLSAFRVSTLLTVCSSLEAAGLFRPACTRRVRRLQRFSLLVARPLFRATHPSRRLCLVLRHDPRPQGFTTRSPLVPSRAFARFRRPDPLLAFLRIRRPAAR